MPKRQLAMSLQKKVSLALLALMAALAVISYVTLNATVAPAFDELDIIEAETDLIRVRRSIQAELKNLRTETVDWAAWDDTYAYVKGERPEFEVSNLGEATMPQLGLDLMLFYNDADMLRWGRLLWNGEPTGLEKLGLFGVDLGRAQKLLHHDTKKSSHLGQVNTELGPMLISSLPVLTSLDAGPIAGTVVLGRFLNEELIATMRAQTAVDFSLRTTADRNFGVPPKAMPFNPYRTNGGAYIANGDTIMSYGLIYDLFGRPSVSLRTNSLRQISILGHKTIRGTLLMLTVASILVAFFIWLLLRGMIVRPLEAIATHLREMRDSRDLSRKIGGNRNDEIGFVAQEFDKMTTLVEQRTAELHKLAYYDSVTGLPNRTRLLDDLQGLIDAATGTNLTTAVVLLDVDRFSFVNETIGYEGGSELLKTLGERLTQALHELNDSTGGLNLVARAGDDEFACVIQIAKDGADLVSQIDRIRRVIEHPFYAAQRELFLKASFGVAQHPSHGSNAQKIYRNAEAALIRAKRETKNGVIFYERKMQQFAKRRWSMEAKLRKALNNGEIVAHFQPLLDLKTHKLAGVEALARWIKPDGASISPADFIPLSEEMGLSDRLFESILHFTCQSQCQWRKQSNWEIPVSVNLSAQQLRNPNLVGDIARILDKYNISPKLINVELTETAVLDDLTRARLALTQLTTFGIDVHIDDFGTGYSSLSYLVELPVQTLKIDGSFVARLLESSANTRLFTAIIGLAKAIDLEIVVEGVETEQQLALVESFGCDFAQGFLIGKPMPPKQFQTWYAARAKNMAPAHQDTPKQTDETRNSLLLTE